MTYHLIIPNPICRRGLRCHRLSCAWCLRRRCRYVGQQVWYHVKERLLACHVTLSFSGGTWHPLLALKFAHEARGRLTTIFRNFGLNYIAATGVGAETHRPHVHAIVGEVKAKDLHKAWRRGGLKPAFCIRPIWPSEKSAHNLTNYIIMNHVPQLQKIKPHGMRLITASRGLSVGKPRKLNWIMGEDDEA